MRRNIIWMIVTALVVGFGITFQVVGTTSHEEKGNAPAQEQTTQTPAVPDPGKPGEAPKG